MIRFFTAAFLLLALSVSSAADVQLVADGKSSHVIVLADQPTEVERTAARELQEYLQRVTGANLPVQHEREIAAGVPRIVIGSAALAGQFGAKGEFDALGSDGICMKTSGNNLLLTGSPPRGVLYAVYTFLEDVAGCRWWTSTEESIPNRRSLSIPQLNTTHTPKLLSREAFYRDAFSAPFAPRLKLNGHFAQIPHEYGGNISIVGWCHTFFEFLPPDRYFAGHPDWYSLADGKRSCENTQLCLTNKAMLKEFTRVVLEQLRAAEAPRIISVSQNDCFGRCTCSDCMSIEQAEGSPSGPLLHFVNAVAEEVEKEFPDVLVETLAYQYTRQAPKHIRPRRNVLIRLCTSSCSYSQPLGTGPQNASFRDDMKAWSDISPQIFVWNYVTNFTNYLLPHPNIRSLGPDIRFFVDHKTVGLFEQGDSSTTTGDFVRLRTWVLAHQMWDPSRNQQALIREFLDGYYGPAGPHLLEYLKLLDGAIEKSGEALRSNMDSTQSWLTLDTINEATRRFDKAANAVAGDPKLSRRVARERLPLDLAWLARYHSLKAQANRRHAEFLGPTDGPAACRDWIARQKEFENTSYGEGLPFDDLAGVLSRRFRTPAAPPEFCRDRKPGDWFDIQDNFFELYEAGKWARFVEDASASDGEAASMPTDHGQWAVQYHVSEDLLDPGPWHCYMFVRSQTAGRSGPAMTVGLHDDPSQTSISSRPVSIEESRGGYVPIDLGTHELRTGMYFWVAPCDSKESADAVFVDRIVLVREEARGAGQGDTGKH